MTLLAKYISPENESSTFKGIPISLRYSDEVRNLMMTRMFSVKYRGTSKHCGKNSYFRPQSYCHSKQADTFAIYPSQVNPSSLKSTIFFSRSDKIDNSYSNY